MPRYNELGELEHSIPDNFLENKYAGWIWLALSLYLWSGGAYMLIANDWPPFWISMDRADDFLLTFLNSIMLMICAVLFWGITLILVATYGTYRGIKQFLQYIRKEPPSSPIESANTPTIDNTLGWSEEQIIATFGKPEKSTSIGPGISIGEWILHEKLIEIWFREGISYQINAVISSNFK